jgi:hypothetical protein
VARKGRDGLATVIDANDELIVVCSVSVEGDAPGKLIHKDIIIEEVENLFDYARNLHISHVALPKPEDLRGNFILVRVDVFDQIVRGFFQRPRRVENINRLSDVGRARVSNKRSWSIETKLAIQ